MCNLCRGTPLPEYSLVGSMVFTLCKVFKTQTDAEVLTNVACALSVISDNEAGKTNMLSTGVTPYIVQHMGYTRFHLDLLTWVVTPILASWDLA